MTRLRIQFPLRALLVVIALAALNLAAARATWRWYPPGGWIVGGMSMAHCYYQHDELGLNFAYFDYYRDHRAPRGPGGEILEVSRRGYTSRSQALSPASASLALTFLIPSLLLVRTFTSRRGRAAATEGWVRLGRPGIALIAGSIGTTASVVGLILAAAVYRTPSEPFDVKFRWSSMPARPGLVDLEDLFGGCPKTLIVRVDGRTAVSHHVDGSDLPVLARGVTRQFSLPGREYTMESATIDCGIDDSVVAYGGMYDHKLSEPKVIRPASRSWFDIWWLPVGSALVTVYVLLDLGWRLRAHFRAATARARFTPRGARS